LSRAEKGFYQRRAREGVWIRGFASIRGKTVIEFSPE